MAGILPRDVTMEILLRVPMKSIRKFSCVCKSWHALLKNPMFTALRSSLHRNNGHHVLLKYQNDFQHKNAIALISTQTLNVLSPLEIPFPTSQTCFNIVGCSNGLVCLNLPSSVTSFFLWNPTTNKIRQLPAPRIPNPPSGCFCNICLGFGYDFRTNDYKLVRIVFLENSKSRGATTVMVEMYKWSTNSWTDINVKVPGRIYDPFGRFVNGVLYWVGFGFDQDQDSQCIVAFDVGDDLFQKIMLLDFDGLNEGKLRNILVYKESPALICYKVCEDDKIRYNIWMMMDQSHKGDEFWTKELSIGPYYRRKLLVWCFKDGTILMYFLSADCDTIGHSTLYDPSTQESKTIVVDWCRVIFDAQDYVESLVPVVNKGYL